jgi:pimeloyl-ACP methyl ester carboxylesterase
MIMSIGVISAVTSTDGTSIGYRMIGQGPGLVILHGAMESATSHSELAAEVGDSHTVYLPDRRGRGMSGPHRANHDINTEVDDLAAVLAATGATDVLGASSGAVIALEASLRLPQLHRVAIFEPPLIVGDSLSTSFVARYREELGCGDLPSALVTGMKGSKMGPAIFAYVPRPLLRALTVAAMRREERTLGSNEVSHADAGTNPRLRLRAGRAGTGPPRRVRRHTRRGTAARRRIQPGLPANRDGCPRRRPADGTPDHISQTWPRRYGGMPALAESRPWRHALFGSSSPIER